MSEFELQTLLIEVDGTITDQFQFWMAATFAVVIASYTAGERLALWARVSIAVLYAAAVAMFYLRYRGSVGQMVEFVQQLRDLGVEMEFSVPPQIVGGLRRFVMFGGSILTIVLICKPTFGNMASSGQDDA